MVRTCIAGLPLGGAARLSTVMTSTRSDSHASAATLCPRMRVSWPPPLARASAAAASACDETLSACAAWRVVCHVWWLACGLLIAQHKHG
jgi:hypothetical protein